MCARAKRGEKLMVCLRDSDGEISERTGAWTQRGSKAPVKGRRKYVEL